MILQGFESLAQNLAIDVRYEKCDFAGGICRIKNKTILIINSKLPLERKINLIAASLKQLNLNQIYIRPALRQLIEGSK